MAIEARAPIDQVAVDQYYDRLSGVEIQLVEEVVQTVAGLAETYEAEKEDTFHTPPAFFGVYAIGSLVTKPEATKHGDIDILIASNALFNRSHDSRLLRAQTNDWTRFDRIHSDLGQDRIAGAIADRYMTAGFGVEFHGQLPTEYRLGQSGAKGMLRVAPTDGSHRRADIVYVKGGYANPVLRDFAHFEEFDTHEGQPLPRLPLLEITASPTPAVLGSAFRAGQQPASH